VKRFVLAQILMYHLNDDGYEKRNSQGRKIILGCFKSCRSEVGAEALEEGLAEIFRESVR